MHGGLFSEDDVTLNDIRSVDRKREPPDSGKLAHICFLNTPRFNCRLIIVTNVTIFFKTLPRT